MFKFWIAEEIKKGWGLWNYFSIPLTTERCCIFAIAFDSTDHVTGIDRHSSQVSRVKNLLISTKTSEIALQTKLHEDDLLITKIHIFTCLLERLC